MKFKSVTNNVAVKADFDKTGAFAPPYDTMIDFG